MLRASLAIGCLALLAGTARAQQSRSRPAMPESYRAYQIRVLENERRTIITLIDSMPARYFRDRATPEQRDFGQQLYHAVQAFTHVLPHYAGVPKPSIADTSAQFDQANLRAYVSAVYDWAEAVARSQTTADRESITTFFDNERMPKWQIWDELHHHAMWTLGQTVANFRIHGIPPAAFTFF